VHQVLQRSLPEFRLAAVEALMPQQTGASSPLLDQLDPAETLSLESTPNRSCRNRRRSSAYSPARAAARAPHPPSAWFGVASGLGGPGACYFGSGQATLARKPLDSSLSFPGAARSRGLAAFRSGLR